MAKFHGIIGYGHSVEDPVGSGVYVDKIVEFPYTGDVMQNTRALEQGEGLNDNISVGNLISIVADQHAVEHFVLIKYIEWVGVRWTVTNVKVQRPRLILTLGSVYNGPTP